MLSISSMQFERFPDLEPPLNLLDDSISKQEYKQPYGMIESIPSSTNSVIPITQTATSVVTPLKPSQSAGPTTPSPGRVVKQSITATTTPALAIPKASTSQVPYTQQVTVPPTAPVATKVLVNGTNKPAAVASSTDRPRTGRTFMKFTDNNGKVSLIEVFVDPNNPRIFRRVAPNKNASPVIPILMNAKSGVKMNPMNTSSQLKMVSLSNQIPLTKLNAISVVKTPSGIPAVVQTIPAGLHIAPVRVGPKVIHPSIPSTSNRIAIPVAALQAASVSKIDQNSAPLTLKNKLVFGSNSANRTVRPSQPQVSLLKPQVSLLKSASAEKPNPMSFGMDNRNLKVVTIKDIKGLPNKQINVFIGKEFHGDATPDPAVAIKLKKHPEKSRSDKYPAEELEKLFGVKQFSNVRNAVVWLLRRVPLITPLATQIGYQHSFPFTVENEEKYNSLLIGKQRSLEVSKMNPFHPKCDTAPLLALTITLPYFHLFFQWLRSKYIYRIAKQHPNTEVSTQIWTTKQIVQFSRRFGFTPEYNPSTRTRSSPLPSSNLKELIQTEINREHLQNDTISFNTIVSSWITKTEEEFQLKDRKSFPRPNDDEIVVVDDIDDESDAAAQAKRKNAGDKSSLESRIPDNLQMESSWITEICRISQIKLQPEEIVSGKKKQ